MAACLTAYLQKVSFNQQQILAAIIIFLLLTQEAQLSVSAKEVNAVQAVVFSDLFTILFPISMS